MTDGTLKGFWKLGDKFCWKRRGEGVGAERAITAYLLLPRRIFDTCMQPGSKVFCHQTLVSQGVIVIETHEAIIQETELQDEEHIHGKCNNVIVPFELWKHLFFDCMKWDASGTKGERYENAEKWPCGEREMLSFAWCDRFLTSMALGLPICKRCLCVLPHFYGRSPTFPDIFITNCYWGKNTNGQPLQGCCLSHVTCYRGAVLFKLSVQLQRKRYDWYFIGRSCN